MTKVAQKVKKDLAALPFSDREEILEFLLDLQKWECVPDGSAEWLAELDRRTEEFKKDPSIGIPAEEVFAKLEKKYGKTRNSAPVGRTRIRKSGRLLRAGRSGAGRET